MTFACTHASATQVYPYDPQLLLGLFSVDLGDEIERGGANASLSRTARDGNDGRAFIGGAFSCDGRTWSRLFRVASSSGRRLGRAYDQPVDGLMVEGDVMSVLIHRHVYEISPEAPRQSALVRRALSRHAMDGLAHAARPSLIGCGP